jgi:hypothetical protein
MAPKKSKSYFLMLKVNTVTITQYIYDEHVHDLKYWLYFLHISY